jgi:hypothetical protein
MNISNSTRKPRSKKGLGLQKKFSRLERRAACTPEKLYKALADLYWLERFQPFDFVVKKIEIRDELGFLKEDFNKVYRTYKRDLRGVV